MKEFFNKVAGILPGFRSDKTWKKIVASIYYLIAIIVLFSNFWLFLFLITAPYFIFGISNLVKANKNGISQKWTPVIIIGVIMIISLILSPSATDNSSSKDLMTDKPAVSYTSNSSEDEATSPPTATPKPTPEPTPELTIYKAGSYKIGTDMPAGEYKLFAKDTLIGMSYYELCKDSSGEFNSIICNDNYSNFTYLTVEDGQYLNMRDAYAVPAEELSPYEPEDGKYVTGMYKVGFDIPAGEYKVKVDESSLMGMAYVERSKNSKHQLSSIISNDNITEEKYITIKDGEYLKMQGGFIDVPKK